MTEIQRFLTFDSRSKPRINLANLGRTGYIEPSDQITGSLINQMVDVIKNDQITASLINQMVDGIKKSTIVSVPGENASRVESVSQILSSFDREDNQTLTSDYQDWLASSKSSASVSSFMVNGWIEFHVYHLDPEANLIAIMALAIGMFDSCFVKGKTGNLKIYASLDNGKRVLSFSPDKASFADLAKRSAGYTVSGVTYPSRDLIILTKKQEIVKLLFHEMIHYSGIDSFMPSHSCPVLGRLDLRESFAEAGSVVLHSALTSIICSSGPEKAFQDFKTMMATEYLYSRRLATQILRYHGYSQEEIDSFPLPSKDHQSPIAIWEYVLYRTNILADPENLIKCLIIRDPESQHRIRERCLDNSLFKELSMDYLVSHGTTIDVSYIYHDIDWSLV